MREKEYNPDLDFTLTVRDQIAMGEHSVPTFETNDQKAAFLGVPVNHKAMGTHEGDAYMIWKWRYMLADAALKVRKGEPFGTQRTKAHTHGDFSGPGVMASEVAEGPR